MNERPRTVLIVDDEALFRRSLADGLLSAGEQHGFVIRTAYNGREAIAVIENEPVDLVLTDLRMPQFDGLQLIAWMISTRRAIPTVVMTAVPSIEARAMLRECGVFSMLQKPVDLVEVEQCIVRELSAKRARLEGIALVAYLQLLSMERSTSVVTIRSRGRVGWLEIDNGDLVGAAFEELEGPEAAYALVGLPEVVIEMVERSSIDDPKIRVGLSGVILEALRLRDERERGAKRLTSRPPSELGDDFDIEFNVLRTVPPPAMAAPVIERRAIDDSAPTLMAAPLRSDAVATVSDEDARIRHALETLVVGRVRGLIGAEVWTAFDQRPVAWTGASAATSAVFDRITDSIREALDEAKYPSLQRYYVVDLEQSQLAVVVSLATHHAAMLLDQREAQLGMVLTVVVPDFVRALREAVAKRG